MSQPRAMTSPTRSGTPATARKIRLVRRFYRDVLARGSEQAADELIAPDAVVELPIGTFSGPAGVKRASVQIGSVFSDLRAEAGDFVAEGDRVLARWRLCGTERRELFGVPPTGKWTCLNGWSVTRISGNQIVEHQMIEGRV